MIFHQLNPAACRTYLIACEKTKEAILVDPVLEHVNDYLDRLKDEELKLRYVIDTHTHADHISGAAALVDRTGVQYIMHTNAPTKCARHRVDEGDDLRLGSIALGFMYTPGHTTDSLTIRLPDRLLTGDFLFIGEGGAGRTDLPGGNPGVHYDSIQKLKSLPDDLLIFPAHDYHQKTHSTLGLERKSNPRLQPRSRQDYIAWLLDMKLPPADWMKNVLKANYACAQDPKAAWIPVDVPACEVKGTLDAGLNAMNVQTITPTQLKEKLTSSTPPVVVDVREPDEYTGELGHIRQSQLIPLGTLSSKFDAIDSYRHQEIVTVCRSGGRSHTAAAMLMRTGFENVASLEGGMTGWNKHGFLSEHK